MTVSPCLVGVALVFMSLTVALVATLLALRERDLVKAAVYSAAQAAAYSLAFYILMAPDIALAYIAVGVGIYTGLLLYAIGKTERYEAVGEEQG